MFADPINKFEHLSSTIGAVAVFVLFGAPVDIRSVLAAVCFVICGANHRDSSQLVLAICAFALGALTTLLDWEEWWTRWPVSSLLLLAVYRIVEHLMQ